MPAPEAWNDIIQEQKELWNATKSRARASKIIECSRLSQNSFKA